MALRAEVAELRETEHVSKLRMAALEARLTTLTQSTSQTLKEDY